MQSGGHGAGGWRALPPRLYSSGQDIHEQVFEIVSASLSLRMFHDARSRLGEASLKVSEVNELVITCVNLVWRQRTQTLDTEGLTGK